MAHNRGGVRRGAGRQALPDELRRIKCDLRLRRTMRDRLDRARQALGLSRGEYVEMLMGD